MGEEYATGRTLERPLIFRLQCRALVATWEYLQKRGPDPAPRVLELGAADGLTLLEIRRLLGERGEYHGVELSSELFGRCPIGIPKFEVYHGDVTELPPAVKPNHYSLVTALALLEHLDDPERCVQEAFRVAEPGGVFVATSPNPWWDGISGRLGLVRDDFHVRRLDSRSMIRLFEQAGFVHVEFRPFMWVAAATLPYFKIPVPASWCARLDQFVRRLGRWTAPMFVNQMVVGEKPEAPDV